jgi:thioredoxin-related protein
MNKYRQPARLALLVILVMVIYGGVVLATQPKELVPWRDDYAAAQVEAKQSGKQLFLDFTGAACPPCQYLKSHVWTDATVARAMSKYIPVRVDCDLASSEPLAEKFGIEATPTFIILDESGKVIHRGEGAAPPDLFLQWLKGDEKPLIEAPAL